MILKQKVLGMLPLWLLPMVSFAQSPAQIFVEEREIVTYPFDDPNPVAIHEKSAKIYPYHLFEGYSVSGKKQKWKVVKMENDYVEVYVLPEAGGKVWGAIEKSTGREFIYRNEVMKFRNIAMRGPWASGGIEFNFGFVGHTPSTATPVDYAVRKNEDGSVSCTVGNIDLPSRTQWRVEIRLPHDKAYFETRALWNNPTGLYQSYYNWMTAAAVVSDDLAFYYPGTRALEHDGSTTPWPRDEEGRDLSKYPNNAFGSHKSIHTVGEYNDFMGGYYHQTNFGFGHWALYDEMPGRKLWLWALSRNGGIWEDLLTDTDGQYMEFQAGRMLNQYIPPSSYKTSVSQVAFSPMATDRWTEIWFPFKAIGGMKEVSPYGVLNVETEGSALKIGINALAFASAILEVTSGGKIVHKEARDLKPMDVWDATVRLDIKSPYVVTVRGMDLSYTSNRETLKRPFAVHEPRVRPGLDAYYREGVELKEYRDYTKAGQIFKACLKDDSLHFGALVNLSELSFRSGKYDSALHYVNTVLRHDTYHPPANYLAGVIYKAMGDKLNALESFGWAARSLEYKSAAYAQMAAVKIMDGDAAMAEHYGRKALDYDKHNVNALHMVAVACRLAGEKDKALKVLEQLSILDPLDHFARYERSLLVKTEDALTEFSALISNEFPFQTCLEVALEYYALGMVEEATEVLLRSPKHPLISLWLAYLKKDTNALSGIAATSPAFVFPFRRETLHVLEWARSHHHDWKFKYYLGLNYWAVQRSDEAKMLFTACGAEPDYAPFYLTRARLLKDQGSMLQDLQRANQLAPQEWRTWNDLIDYYERVQQYKVAADMADKAYRKFSDSYTLGFSYAKALLNNGQYDACLRVLKELYILPFEGSGQGQSVYEQALLLSAVERIQKKKYKEALDRIEASRKWPENLGVGKPYDVDTRIQDYLTALCLEKLGRNAEASRWQQKVIVYGHSNYDEATVNNYLSLLSLTKLGEEDGAAELVQKLKSSGAAKRPAQRWVIAHYENNGSAIAEAEKDLGKDKYLMIVQKVIGL